MLHHGVKKRLLWLACFAVILSICGGLAAAWAETRYVSDMLIISLREGQDDESPSIGYIKSDTPVEVIEENDDFVLVKTPEDLTGWVKKRFLVSEKPKTLVIEEQRQRIQDLEDKIILLQQNPSASEDIDPTQTQAYEKKIQELQNGLNSEKQHVVKLEDELARANVSYQQLMEKQKQAPQAQGELQALKQKNSELLMALQQAEQTATPTFFTGNIKWFLSGAGVLLLGFVIGRSLRRKRIYRY